MANNKVTKIKIRMYRAGTGDFFLYRFYKGEKLSYTMMIDCGCIHGTKEKMVPMVQGLRQLLMQESAQETDPEIDLLVVTHEHADHINGFQKAQDVFDKIVFKKVWFAWTEDKSDEKANEYRKNFTKLKLGLNEAATKLNGLVNDKYYENYFGLEPDKEEIIKNQYFFIDSINSLNELNLVGLDEKKTPTMEDLLRDFKVIKEHTKVEFYEPGDLIEDISGAEGMRFFVLGPPRDLSNLSKEESKTDGYEKRESKSTVDFSFTDALLTDTNVSPFDADYLLPDEAVEVDIVKNYRKEENKWRNIDQDWLYGAGSLGLRLQQSINNTSLALALQFEDTERVLLLPGDAEYGNWQSWHDKLTWEIETAGVKKTVNAEYLLNHTVFYKVGHHLSQNGTAKSKGLEMMKSNDLTAMVTLDLDKIMSGWRNTMPNDIIGSELIRKTKGKVYFLGNRIDILYNIKTNRVNVQIENENELNSLNQIFDGKDYIECEII